jgi:NTE family protein
MKPFELFLNEIPRGQLIDFLMASASFPIFKLEKMDGKMFIDGGVFDNMPINLLIRKGYKDITVIRTYGIGVYKKIIDQSIKITYINPSEDLGGVLDFDNKKAKDNLQLGYFDTMRKYRAWKGKTYFIEPEANDDRMIEFLLGIPDPVIEQVGQIFGYKNIPAKRMLFEFILPRISDLLILPKESSYQDIIIGLCEEIAKKVELNRFKLFTFDQFIREVSSLYVPKKKKQSQNIPTFIKQNELLSHFVSDSIFSEIASKIIH